MYTMVYISSHQWLRSLFFMLFAKKKKKIKEDVIYCHVSCVTLIHFQFLVIPSRIKVLPVTRHGVLVVYLLHGVRNLPTSSD